MTFGPGLLSQQLWPPNSSLCIPLLSLQTLHSPLCTVQSLQVCYYKVREINEDTSPNIDFWPVHVLVYKCTYKNKK